MKLLIITDLHHWTDEEIEKTKAISDYDICFLLGDISPDKLRILKRIISQPIYALNGNHDLIDTVESVGLTNIHNKVIEHNGITFSGLQGAARYKRGPFCMYSQEESIKISEGIPPADIFLTHAGYEDSHHGLEGIERYIKRCKPKFHIYGHLHNNSKDEYFETVSICVYRCAVIDTETLLIDILY